MRPQGTQQHLEKRRRLASQLLKSGKNLSATARAVSASVSSVFRWWQAYGKTGLKGLQAKPTPGRPCQLSPAQKDQLVKLLLQGPMAAGYQNELWTLKRVAALIERHFAVHYHPCHVWKLLTALGWSCQQPERRDVRRDEEAIAHWKQYKWPRIKKAHDLGAHLVFLDERGFLLIPNLTRTWAPKGQTPYHKHLFKQGKISTIGALTVSPKRKHLALYLQFHPQNLTGLEVKAFLRSLLQHLRGPIMLLWDRGTIHRRQEVGDYLHHHPRVHMEDFPAYAPELNPAEYIWNQTDRALYNTAPENLADLQTLLSASVARLHSSQKLLWSCIYASDLPWTR